VPLIVPDEHKIAPLAFILLIVISFLNINDRTAGYCINVGATWVDKVNASMAGVTFTP
jgi:hypothetical protein